MSAPSHLRLDRMTEPGHVLLRAASAINDLGAGPLEIRARRDAYGRWRVYQAIYGSRRRRPDVGRNGRRHGGDCTSDSRRFKQAGDSTSDINGRVLSNFVVANPACDRFRHRS